MSTQEKNPDLKELANTLSNAYNNILQHSTLGQEKIISNLDLLSKYVNDLPMTWFTPQLLDTLLVLKDKSTPAHISLLGPIVVLFSSWLRRLPNDNNNGTINNPHLNAIQETLLQILTNSNNLYNDDYVEAQKNAWIGWVSCIGKGQDAKLLQGMTQTIQHYTTITVSSPSHESVMTEAIDAGVAHALAQTDNLNDFEVEDCEKLLNIYIEFTSKKRKDEGGLRAIMTTLEHVVDVRSKEKPQARADADLNTLVNLASELVNQDNKDLDVYFARVAVLAGVVRMLQFNQGKVTKKVAGLRTKAEHEFTKQLSLIVDIVALPQHVKMSALNQDKTAFFASRCLIQIPDKTVEEMANLDVLLKLLSAALLTSPNTFSQGELIHQLENVPQMTEAMHQLVNQPSFKDIGRISRVMAKLIQIQLLSNEKTAAVKVIQFILDRLVGFSYNIFFDWDCYLIKYSSRRMTPEETKNFKELENNVWVYFKSLTFAFTVILKSVAVDIPDGLGFVQVSHAAQDIISIYANINFITEHLGEGAGKQAYQDTLTNSVAFLLQDDHKCQLNKLLSLAFKEYASSIYTQDQTQAVELLSTVKQSRLTFFTDLSEQVMSSIDDTIFEQDILPVFYPILKWKRVEHKDLYESAHTAIISAFIAEKSISRELAGIYSNILIDRFPEPMNLDQFRFGYHTLIQSLCSMDDALAWLTVNQLIVKIDSLSKQEELRLKSEYTTALIDMLKPLSLGPFFPSILDTVRRLVLEQPTKGMQKATMKIIFETVSGNGVSDMRRTEAVGWFLEMKRELEL